MLETHNDNRKEKQYHVGQVVCEMKYGEKNNLKPRSKKQIATITKYYRTSKFSRPNRVLQKINSISMRGKWKSF